MGHTEQIKMTNTPDTDESLMVYSARGIQANGLMGLSICMNGSQALYKSGLMPITNPKGTATAQASKKPSATRNKE